MTAIPVLSAVAILAIAVSTFSLVTFAFTVAPAFDINISRVPSGSLLLTPAAQQSAFREPTDTAVLITWWVIAALMTIVGLILARTLRRPHQDSPKETPRWPSWVIFGATGASIGVVIASLTWSEDKLDQWIGVPLSGMALGSLLAVGIAVTWFARYGLARLVAFMLAVGALALAIPSLLQLPWSVRDDFHYRFAADEMAAVAAGHFPLADYVPQYSALLGWPIAPLLKILGQNATLGIVAWLVFLQFVGLIIAVALPALIAGRRFIVPAIVVAVGVPLATVAGPEYLEAGLSATTYFLVTPLRTVLPALAILVAFLVLRPGRKEVGAFTRRRMLECGGLGFLLAITVVNNLDFGGACAAAVILATVLASPTLRWAAVALASQVVGASLFVGAYSMLGVIVGHPVSWRYLLIFPEFHGLAGYFTEPMEGFGIHIAVASLFVCAAATGVIMLVVGRRAQTPRVMEEGLLLTLVGVWSLLALAYFAGRSFPSTLAGGMFFSAGMTAAAFLPAVRRSLRLLLYRSHGGSPLILVGGALSVTLLVGSTSFWSLIRDPAFYLDRGGEISLSGLPTFNPVVNMRTEIATASPAATALLEAGRVDQAVAMSSVLALANDLPSSVAVTNDWRWFSVSTIIPEIFCVSRQVDWGRYVWMDRDMAVDLKQHQECGDALNFDRSVPLHEGDDASPVLVPWRG